MGILDRGPELEELRQQVRGPGPTLSLVTGGSGTGKSTLARQATAGTDGVWYRASMLPDADHRALLAGRIGAWLAASAPADLSSPVSPDASWAELFGRVVDVVDSTRRPLLLALDDAHRLLDARARWADDLAHLWSRARAHALPVHVLLCGPRPELETALASTDPPLLDAVTADLHLEPLPYRRVTALAGRWPAADRLRAWAIFGGLPSRLARLDPSVGLATNVQRLVLDPAAPFLLHEERELAVETQSPARYASILGSLAQGHREWGEILAGAPGFDRGGTMAPYLARLEASGRVRAERSLDASERSRSRRYSIQDPFTAFWYRLVLPWLTDAEAGRGAEVWSRRVRPGLDAHVADVLPVLCRQWLRLHGHERLPASARQVGGLWGPGYDLPVAGTLGNGQTFYGRVLWAPPRAPGESVADEISRELRETRYGFGREARHRLVFTTVAPATDLVRRSARDRLVHVIDLQDLLGRQEIRAT